MPARNSIASSTTGICGRWTVTSLERMAYCCGYARLNPTFASPRRHSHAPIATGSRSMRRGVLLTSAGYIAQEFTRRAAPGARRSRSRSSRFCIPRATSPSPSAVWPRAKPLAVRNVSTFVLGRHVRAWADLWRRFDIRLQPAGREFRLNLPMLLRLNMFHLLQAVSLNSIGLDIGVPARGWTGEAYQGHVFWDELFIFPALNYRAPELTRSLLMYRYRRLNEARAAAAASAGLRGAMFPWQSGSDGQEETQELNLNHRSRRWIPDNSFRQRHVGSAIAYNAWQYFQVTQDFEFLHFYGAELILDIAHFWSSIAIFNDERQRYEIRGVMGPDEFHEAYPDSDSLRTRQQCVHQCHGGLGPAACTRCPADPQRHPPRRAAGDDSVFQPRRSSAGRI